jgi:hypothetical protein
MIENSGGSVSHGQFMLMNYVFRARVVSWYTPPKPGVNQLFKILQPANPNFESVWHSTNYLHGTSDMVCLSLHVSKGLAKYNRVHFLGICHQSIVAQQFTTQ